MKKAYYVFLIIAALILSNCAGKVNTLSSTIPPSTLDVSDISEYPASKYLTATGIGQSESEARRQAKAELSNIFESKVSSDIRKRVKSVIGETGNETVTRDAEQNIRVVSAIQLKGVQIGKTWYNQEQKVYYALAILDRHQARENWQSELDDIDGKIEAALTSLDSLKSSFSKLQSLRNTHRQWIEREAIASRLRVLGFHDFSMKDYDVKTIFHKIQQIRANMLILIDIQGGEYAELIQKVISEKLSKEGFALSDMGKRANIFINGSVKIEPVKLNNPELKYARVTVSMAIIDSEIDITVGELTENKRAAHLNYTEAAHQAVKKVSNSIAQKLVEYFDGTNS